MSITGYTCGDLFGQQLLLEEAEMGLMQILNNTRQLDIISIVGMPVVVNSTVINSAVVIQKGKVLALPPKLISLTIKSSMSNVGSPPRFN